MTLAQIITNIRNLTDETDETQLTDAVITVFVNRRYKDMVGRITNVFEDFFGTTDQTLDTVADQAEYSLPSGVRKIKRVEISYDGDNYKLARPFDLNHKQTTESDTTSAHTQTDPFYYLFGDSIGFDPIPDAAGTNNIKIWYIAQPSDLSGSATPEIPTEYHDLLVYGASADVKKRDDNWAAAVNYENDYEKGIAQMINEIVDRQIQEPRSVTDVSDLPRRDPADYVEAGSLSES